jgi:tight adherence protein B
MDTAYYLFAVMTFAVVVLSIEGLYLWLSSRKGSKRIEKRLTSMSFDLGSQDGPASIVKERMLGPSPAVDRFLRRIPQVVAFDRTLQQSGKEWTAAQFIGYTAAIFFGTLIAASFLPFPQIVGLVAAGFAAVIPAQIVLHARAKRMKKFEEQLPEAADLMSRALRSGHAFPSALQMVGTEMPEPIATEFRIAFDEINFGIGMNKALQNMTTRMPLADLRYFVIAVLIQRESGGNLAEILGSISSIIRQRLALLSRVRVLSAEGKLSAWILGGLPFATGAMMMIVNPGFLNVLFTDPVGIKMVGGALVLMALGIVWMRKIIKIRV